MPFSLKVFARKVLTGLETMGAGDGDPPKSTKTVAAGEADKPKGLPSWVFKKRKKPLAEEETAPVVDQQLALDQALAAQRERDSRYDAGSTSKLVEQDPESPQKDSPGNSENFLVKFVRDIGRNGGELEE